MGTGSEGSASNASVSYNIWNRKIRLIDSGTNIEAATKVGAGQEAYCDSASANKKLGVDYITDPTNKLWIRKIDSLSYPSQVGFLYPCSSTFASNLDGLLTVASSSGTVGLSSFSSTDGLANTFTSGAVNGNAGGFNLGLVYTSRDNNPSIRCKWKLDSSASTLRLFIGWTASTSAVGNNDDQLNALSGFGVGKSTTNGNYRILHNDSAGATISDDTGIAADTSTHTIDLWGDGANNQFWWSLDGSGATAVTTDIPSATTGLSMQALVITTSGAKVLSVYRHLIGSS